MLVARAALTASIAFYALPFVTLTAAGGCDETEPVHYTGAQIVAGTGPAVRPAADAESDAGVAAVEDARAKVRALAIAALACALAGLAVSLVRRAWANRALAAGGTCAAALLMLIHPAVSFPQAELGDPWVNVSFGIGCWLVVAALLIAAGKALATECEVGLADEAEGLPASLERRMAASLIDAVVLSPLLWLVVTRGIVGVACLVAGWVLYAASFERGRGGATLGKLAVGIRVEPADGTRISAPTAVVRAATRLAGVLTLAGLLAPLVAPGGRGLPDLVARTAIVRGR